MPTTIPNKWACNFILRQSCHATGSLWIKHLDTVIGIASSNERWGLMIAWCNLMNGRRSKTTSYRGRINLQTTYLLKYMTFRSQSLLIHTGWMEAGNKSHKILYSHVIKLYSLPSFPSVQFPSVSLTIAHTYLAISENITWLLLPTPFCVTYNGKVYNNNHMILSDFNCTFSSSTWLVVLGMKHPQDFPQLDMYALELDAF